MKAAVNGTVIRLVTVHIACTRATCTSGAVLTVQQGVQSCVCTLNVVYLPSYTDAISYQVLRKSCKFNSQSSLNEILQ